MQFNWNIKSLFFICFAVLILTSGTVSADKVNITVSEDTSVRETEPNTNFGTNTTLFDRRDASYNDRVYFKFEVDKPVTSAWLNIYVNNGYQINGFNYLTYISNNWAENTTTWNSGRPTTDVNVNGATIPAFTSGWNSINVSSYISSSGTHSFGTATRNGWWLLLSSREGDYPAYINVTYADTYDTIYVNASHPSASDSNNGTEDYPFETVSGAVQLINSSGNIYITGEYNESVTISGSAKNVTISGYGDSAKIYTTGDENPITLSGQNNLTIKNIDIETQSTTTGQNTLVFDTVSGSNILIHNCNISSFYGTPVSFATGSDVTNATIRNCNITSDESYAGGSFYFSSSASVNGVTLQDNYMYSSYSSSHGITIDGNAGNNITILNNNITAGYDGIMTTTQTSGTFVEGLNIAGNHIWAAQKNNGGSGIYIRAGANNNTIAYNHIHEAVYTAIKLNLNDYNTVHSNVVYPDGYGHNAIETKGSFGWFYNNSVLGHNASNGDSWNVFYGAGEEMESYNLIEDSTAQNTRDRLIAAGGHQNNIIFRNITATNHDGQGIYTFGYWSPGYEYLTSDKLLFDNISINFANSDEYPITVFSPGTSTTAINETDSANYSRDTITFIDTNVTVNTKMWWMVDYYNNGGVEIHKADVYAINPSSEATYWQINYPDYCDSTLHLGYYPNIKVVNPSGQNVEGATLSFSTTATNPETGEQIYPHNLDYGGVEKAYTDTINSSLTLSDGELPDRYENASGAVALTKSTKYYTTTGQSQDVTWTVTATKDGETDTATITPDMLVYSPDSSDSQSTLVTLTLDVDGESGSGGFIAIVGAFILAAGYFWNRRRW
ncbi:DNRLRE domain-containing protein [Methanolobus psychrotolerans]|uniref:DNRLRE domain-containing protein n=1 Tax=Methanolobus psychrotolerans TaxID=1874706 RepID=UPI000B91AEBF|nr:DNRLRE domain-containing protein [Methanolobus psychrotolerans]